MARTTNDGSPEVVVSLTKSQLVLINNALNEVLNAAEFTAAEFGTRLGASKTEAEALLARLGQLLDK